MQEQLAELRARVARVNERYTEAPRGQSPRPAARYVEECLTGQEVETSFGRHFETEKLWEGHRPHGSADIGALSALPHDVLDQLSGGTVPSVPPDAVL